MTGRPHVQDFVERQDIEIGSYRVLEVIGLAQKEVNAYIDKFSRCFNEEQTGINQEQTARNIETINMVKEKSQNIRWLVSIPQFLNTLCCIALLSGGNENIRNVTQLYAWTLALFLNQHLITKQGKATKMVKISNVFVKNLKLMRAIAEIAFTLLLDNQIIIDKESYENITKKLELDSQEKKNFLKGLFVDVSTNRKERYQFKHLTLLEFLTALHCCTVKTAEVMKKLLAKQLFQVIRFICGILGTHKDSESKDMLNDILNDIIQRDAKNQPDVVVILITELKKCKLENQKRLIAIIECALECGCHERRIPYTLQFIQSLKKTDVVLSTAESDRFAEFINVVANECSTDSMRKAFSSVNIESITSGTVAGGARGAMAPLEKICRIISMLVGIF